MFKKILCSLYNEFKKIKKIKEPGIISFSLIGITAGILLGFLGLLIVENLKLLKPIILFNLCCVIGIIFGLVTGLQLEFEKETK